MSADKRAEVSKNDILEVALEIQATLVRHGYDLREIKERAQRIGTHFAGLGNQYASLSNRLDRMDLRIERIERRLDLQDP